MEGWGGAGGRGCVQQQLFPSPVFSAAVNLVLCFFVRFDLIFTVFVIFVFILIFVYLFTFLFLMNSFSTFYDHFYLQIIHGLKAMS